jgi:glycosyl-4,4'-diaponeurosporenoate acyltransferase
MLFHLPAIITIVIDITAWFAIHMGVSYFMSRTSRDSYNPQNWLYRERRWERNGIIYHQFFLVKKWKQLLPDGAAVFKFGFEKKELKEFNKDYLSDFLKETCRAEFTHWIVFLCGFIFSIWNLPLVSIFMIVYGFAANIPCIITQRYNRIRLMRVLE